MNPEEIARRLMGDEIDCDLVDLKRLNNHFGCVKRRKLERRDKRVSNTKISKEASKTVATRLQKKLIDRGKSPNLSRNFYAFNYN